MRRRSWPRPWASRRGRVVTLACVVMVGALGVTDYLPPTRVLEISAAVNTLLDLYTVFTPDLDDAPGIADGDGADPNPFPGTWDSTISGNVNCTGGGDTPYTLNCVHALSAYNGNGITVYDAENFAYWWNFEYGWAGARHSGAPGVEAYLQVYPPTQWLRMAAGSAGSVVIGDLLTFTGGEQCKVTEASTLALNDEFRVICVGKDGPEAGDAITDCDGYGGGGACSGTPSGTLAINATDDIGLRPFFSAWDSVGNSITTEILLEGDRKTDGNPQGTAGRTKRALLAIGSAREVALGWSGSTGTDAAGDMSIVTVPATATFVYGNNGTAGAHMVDTSSNGGTGQWIYGDGTRNNTLIPTDTRCYIKGSADAGVDDDYGDIHWYQPVTIVAAGARNTVSDAATDAVFTLEDSAGNAMTLSGTWTAVDRTATAMTWVTVTAGGGLTSGEGIRIDTTTSSTTTTDDHEICLAYTATRQ